MVRTSSLADVVVIVVVAGTVAIGQESEVHVAMPHPPSCRRPKTGTWQVTAANTETNNLRAKPWLILANRSEIGPIVGSIAWRLEAADPIL